MDSPEPAQATTLFPLLASPLLKTAQDAGLADRGATLRQMRPGQDLNYSFEAFYAKGNPSELTVQPRLYHEGKIVGALEPVRLGPAADASPRLLYNRLLQIRDDIELGDYYLEVIVRDPNRKGDKGVASQWIDFSVVP